MKYRADLRYAAIPRAYLATFLDTVAQLSMAFNSPRTAGPPAGAISYGFKPPRPRVE